MTSQLTGLRPNLFADVRWNVTSRDECQLTSANQEESMRFVPYDEMGSQPNLIVDGAASPSTVLTLSHWPKSGTPAALKRDTSAEIVFAYLDSPPHHVNAEAVSNNHFDEDGLVGIYTLLNPASAQRQRDLLLDVARAGDFGTYHDRDAARIAFAISAFADAEQSPLPKELFALPYAAMAATLYHRLLELLPRLFANPADYKKLWEAEDNKLTASEALIESGEITITERADIDLAVVSIPEALPKETVHRFTQTREAECHPFAIHSRTERSRILLVRGKRIEFQYRYESWVQYVSKRPPARVDLSGLAAELNEEEASGGHWTFDGVDRITPRLYLEGSADSSLEPGDVERRLEQHLRVGKAAWKPYD